MLLELSAGPKRSVKLRSHSSTLFLEGLDWLGVDEAWQRIEIMSNSTFAGTSFIR